VPRWQTFQTVIGLLYRADWTRLSLSAGVRSERDGDLAARRLRTMRPSGLGGYHYGQAELLIAPGGRYLLEHRDETGRIDGSDGARGWMWWRPALAPPPSLEIDIGEEPPLPELLRPSDLLSGFPWTCEGR
jgi:hypothetical protein